MQGPLRSKRIEPARAGQGTASQAARGEALVAPGLGSPQGGRLPLPDEVFLESPCSKLAFVEAQP